MRIDSSGNLGINTTSPRALVDFSPGSGDGTLSQTLSQYQAVFEAPQGTEILGETLRLPQQLLVRQLTQLTKVALVRQELHLLLEQLVQLAKTAHDQSGNVGIGTSSPTALLTVGSTSDSNTNATIASSTSELADFILTTGQTVAR